MNFCAPDLSDKRILFACEYLCENSFSLVRDIDNCDFVLLGVNPDKSLLKCSKPVFAGNVSGNNIHDYTKNEVFAIKNAYLTAEGALALAIQNSSKSMINSCVLITGYGRIGKALHGFIKAFTRDITICARKEEAHEYARQQGAKAIDFEELKNKSNYDFIFNTVPHPVFNEAELSALSKDSLLIELASFTGGIDKHFAKALNLNLINGKGLPSLYSPKSAGIAVGEAVITMIKTNPEVII